MRGKILSTLALIIGCANAIKTSRSSKIQLLAQSVSQQITNERGYTCTTAIDNIQKWNQPNLKGIIENFSIYWNDTDFKPNPESIAWRNTNFTKGKVDMYADYPWRKLSDICENCTLFGSSDKENVGDTVQGFLGDCYFVAPLAAVAADEERFKRIFVNQHVNNAGIYAFNVYIRGIPKIVVIDDYVPYARLEKLPAFTRVHSDWALWPALLEKAWAKVNGNYEKIASGNQFETFQFLLNIPTIRKQSVNTMNTTVAWNLVIKALDSGFIIGAQPGGSTGKKDTDSCQFNLPCAHAYSILSYHIITTAEGKQISLIKFKNPHGNDGEFSGKWADKNGIWNTIGKNGITYAKQIDMAVKSDGIHYLEDFEIPMTFSDLDFGQYRKGWVSSYYDKQNDTQASVTNPAKYRFTLTEATPLYIRVLNTEPRMYSLKCKTPKIQEIRLRPLDAVNDAKTLKYYDDYPGTIDQSNAPLQPGTYEISYLPSFDQCETRDYTVLIYAPKEIIITDVNNKTSFKPSEHDYKSANLKSLVPDQNENLWTTLYQRPVKGQSEIYLTGDLKKDMIRAKQSKYFNLEINDTLKTYQGYMRSKLNVKGKEMREMIVVVGLFDKDAEFNGTISNYLDLDAVYQFSHGNENCQVQVDKSTSPAMQKIICTCLISVQAPARQECTLASLHTTDKGLTMNPRRT
ncbi:calpain family cysteine protease containing protein [Stylonychia lemnae]|uniref:Calpain family cysteine protease containing protein n=1 Tax=Stylonychia lemnae TaxID=5949 RepID=A0A078B6R7_STYLE|nr:calpain family cysteine protease containing protein [Stylonychia lemnae]|eukprot:CDW88987.1 calpain family cysteine protease containing protein [Stylonychia lemnae]